MVTRREISDLFINGEVEQLSKVLMDLRMIKMKMDKQFSEFLDDKSNKLDYDELETDSWKMYKQMMKEYAEVDGLITQANYFFNQSKGLVHV